MAEQSKMQTNETYKSNLIIEANFLKIQGLYQDAAGKFAEAAQIEEQLAEQWLAQGAGTEAAIHQLSALSCWGQAGDLYRAMNMGEQLLTQSYLSSIQRTDLLAYLQQLQQRYTQWASQWSLQLATN